MKDFSYLSYLKYIIWNDCTLSRLLCLELRTVLEFQRASLWGLVGEEALFSCLLLSKCCFSVKWACQRALSALSWTGALVAGPSCISVQALVSGVGLGWGCLWCSIPYILAETMGGRNFLCSHCQESSVSHEHLMCFRTDGHLEFCYSTIRSTE